jgi:glycosyltransferase involved in cell wall biosynthesis
VPHAATASEVPGTVRTQRIAPTEGPTEFLKPMTTIVHLCVWSGDVARARELVSSRYAGGETSELPFRKLRESGFFERVRLLRSLRGRAIVFYCDSLQSFKYSQLLQCIHLLHRCRETVLCEEGGGSKTFRTRDILRAAPSLLWNLLFDLKTLLYWRCYLRLRLAHAHPSLAAPTGGDLEIAYLLPNMATIGTSGGAISHIRGFLNGLKVSGGSCRVFSGTPLAQDAFETEIVAPGRRPYFFWEAAMLGYNSVFTRGVQRYLASSAPAAFYQRHCRFAIAGALLSSRSRVPLILEYNGPEGWIADHWDPTPFRSWVRLCEEVTLRSAARIIVVSEVLRLELLDRGIPADRIRLNPNAVDPGYFSPGPGREQGRRELGVKPDEVLVGFAGSFSLWHGIEVLEQTIVRLLGNQAPTRLRFVLMGNGLLHGAMRSALAAYEKTGDVIFTGSVPSNKVVEYLDASDILVSPHIPMPDGSRFFGSPTKIFEYMAMGKGIVASRLEQIAEVLEHDRTAWLVTPGDVNELSEAILRLAMDPAKRKELGEAARHAAIERHSWVRNVSWALSDLPMQPPAGRAVVTAVDGSTLAP